METLDQLKSEAYAAIEAAEDTINLEKVRGEFLGRKGRVTELLKSLVLLDPDEKPRVGAQINNLKKSLNLLLADRRIALEEQAVAEQIKREAIDVTLPGRSLGMGSIHPITRTIDRIESFFGALGFEVLEGPEIEDDYHNFEALNIPAHHPARAMHDTFYIMSFELIPRACRFERWRTETCLYGLFVLVGFTGVILTSRIHLCFTRWKACLLMSRLVLVS